MQYNDPSRILTFAEALKTAKDNFYSCTFKTLCGTKLLDPPSILENHPSEYTMDIHMLRKGEFGTGWAPIGETIDVPPDTKVYYMWTSEGNYHFRIIEPLKVG